MPLSKRTRIAQIKRIMPGLEHCLEQARRKLAAGGVEAFVWEKVLQLLSADNQRLLAELKELASEAEN